MDVREKYRLELHWSSVSYSLEQTAILSGAYFSGPVLKDAVKLLEEDQLILDMTKQHWLFPPMKDFYQATLRWRGVEYKDNIILLKEAWIVGKYVNSLEKLENKDWILIDCSEHDTAKMVGRKGKRIAPGVYETRFKHSLVYWAEIHREAKGAKY